MQRMKEGVSVRHARQVPGFTAVLVVFSSFRVLRPDETIYSCDEC